MAHLTKIANTVTHFSSNESLPCSETLKAEMQKLPESTQSNWDRFVKTWLNETNEKNTIIPPSSYASASHNSTSEDDDADFKDLQFPQESALQQVKENPFTDRIKSWYHVEVVDKSEFNFLWIRTH